MMESTSTNELKSELENFRQQWLSEVRSRQPESGSAAGPSGTSVADASTAPPTDGVSKAPTSKSPVLSHVDDDYVQPPIFDEAPSPSIPQKGEAPSSSEEPVTALDHFEAAMTKESQGNLGDSLNLYRKAFRMDSRVDLLYRKKHFPPSASRPAQGGPPAPGPAVEKGADAPQSIHDLIARFAGLSIIPAPPEIENTLAPPCPISNLPEEILVHIFLDLAIQDVGDFSRLSQVCKRFAYLVTTEQRIWRRVCLGTEFGFGGMHYHFQRDISWGSLPIEEPVGEGWHVVSEEDRVERERQEKQLMTKALFPGLYASNWRRMFKMRPRVRFNGCYISTVNYIRTGQANTNYITWSSPVHIVTYYRYLRFFRDGTAISLLTTSEPGDVVHYVTKDLLELHRDKGAPHLPSNVMSSALKGRWRMSSAEDSTGASLEDVEGDLYVETEGVAEKYIYRMELSLRSAGKGARNNKLGWRGFYSYNKLTDDWAEFRLKNDKPFFFSRVKSYGVGE